MESIQAIVKATYCFLSLTTIKDNSLLYAIDLVKDATVSQFIEQFGEPVLNPMNWEKKRLADECNIITGNTPSRKVADYYGDYIEWIKSDNITNGGVYLAKAREYLSKNGLKVGRSIDGNSILMTCIAGSIKCIGNVSIADRKVSFNQQINGIEPLKNNVFFMFQQFNQSQKYIQSTINMSLKGILSKGQLSELEFIFPPIELQNEFAKFFKQVDKLKFVYFKLSIIHSSDSTKLHFLYNGFPSSVASKLISVTHFSFASLIKILSILNAIPCLRYSLLV